jgi:hypothetical protein
MHGQRVDFEETLVRLHGQDLRGQFCMDTNKKLNLFQKARTFASIVSDIKPLPGKLRP